MKYQCTKCDFLWEGTSYTFNLVREHEKNHLEKNKSKTSGIKMSLRCKVCNASSDTNLISCNGEWECQTCGNILDVNGNVIPSEN